MREFNGKGPPLVRHLRLSRYLIFKEEKTSSEVRNQKAEHGRRRVLTARIRFSTIPARPELSIGVLCLRSIRGNREGEKISRRKRRNSLKKLRRVLIKVDGTFLLDDNLMQSYLCTYRIIRFIEMKYILSWSRS